MDKRNVIEFFDRLALGWDDDQVIKDRIIERILDNAHISVNDEVLDVACGTGILFPYYMKRGVASVTGVDISPEITRIALRKFAGEPRISVLCGDAEEVPLEKRFGQIMVYNAFPHFADPERLIGHLAALARPGGRLTITHGASREAIDAHHSGSARRVSNGLISVEHLKELFTPYFNVDVLVSDAEMYQVSGIKI